MFREDFRRGENPRFYENLKKCLTYPPARAEGRRIVRVRISLRGWGIVRIRIN